MALEEFAELKMPHLVTLTLIILISALTVGYGIFAFTHRLNIESECSCKVSNGTSIDQTTKRSLPTGGNITCGPAGTF